MRRLHTQDVIEMREWITRAENLLPLNRQLPVTEFLTPGLERRDDFKYRLVEHRCELRAL
jgi:hypothetical protein